MSMGNQTFDNCPNLTNEGLIFGPTITSIGSWNFASCNLLTNVNIPTNINILTSIYAGIVKESSNRNLSKEFLNYISSEKVKHIWIKHGFIISD